MKKLKLKALELGASELLKREQLRNVLGGSGGGSGSTWVQCKTRYTDGSIVTTTCGNTNVTVCQVEFDQLCAENASCIETHCS